jgi:short-subunit dehydrogenase
VLNAGVYLPGLSWEVPLEQWELHVRVNLWGVVHGIRAAVPVMVEQGHGHVVAMASGAGLVATPTLAPYVATKHAVVGTMEALHHELARVAPGVHTSVVCPGNVRTPMAANSLAAAGIHHESLSPVVEPIADAVRAGNDAGEDPSTVADAIVAAVVENRFWVLPQPEVAWAAVDRMQRIQDGREPIDLFG